MIGRGKAEVAGAGLGQAVEVVKAGAWKRLSQSPGQRRPSASPPVRMLCNDGASRPAPDSMVRSIGGNRRQDRPAIRKGSRHRLG